MGSTISSFIVILIYSLSNVGDVSHADAVYNSLKKQTNSDIRRYNIDASLETKTAKEYYKQTSSPLVLSNENYIVLTVGEKGLQFLDHLNKDTVLKKSLKNAFVCVAVHQWLELIEHVPLNYLALPKTSIDVAGKQAFLNKIQYTLMLSVPTTNPTIDSLKDSYKGWAISQKPKLNDPHIIVMLPGDAPDMNGKMKYFTTSSAKNLFDCVYALWIRIGRKHNIIVHNGSRTGKHNPSNGEIVCLHEHPKDHPEDLKIDAVSNYFISLLREKNIPYEFFNFAFEMDSGNRKPISAFNALLYLAQANKQNYFIIPGESVSMLAQVPMYISPEKVIVFKPDSMNSFHEAIFNQLKERGNVSYFTEEGAVVTPDNPVQKIEDDAGQVASDIIKAYQKHLISKPNN